MKWLYNLIIPKLSLLVDLPPLIFRLILAYGFYGPAVQKVQNFDDIISWFGNDLGIPFPTLNAYMAVATECIGVAAMTLGLGTRLMSIPMMVVMCVAVATVHWPNFECGKNGFEVPMYYFFMLFSLLVTGPGRISVDALIKRMVIDRGAQ